MRSPRPLTKKEAQREFRKLLAGIIGDFPQHPENPGVFVPRTPRWTGQNRPFIDTSKPAISGERLEASEFYRTLSPDCKSVWTFVRQLGGPHFSTCA